ncbi:hypothetical protein BJ684DRAFT_21910 [Piptocephalis cylindrospora]|uniref:Uncharacterized protein n=1 Tax=Piptocephalis cylindrospora TaxID=1907219 RepID=A0A4P9XYK0_9FUNG|nr:hypothetical protein BJ684DRAFT_21910 [Piptocephalis cylindrospora]|eukprot:RKP11513.1 hypothetical protein BJ684DRAFT_21910 [Piptocephalis cylindrospora]
MQQPTTFLAILVSVFLSTSALPIENKGLGYPTSPLDYPVLPQDNYSSSDGSYGQGGVTGLEDDGTHGISSWSSDADPHGEYLVKRGVTDREDYGDHGISSWTSDDETQGSNLVKRGVTDRKDYGDHGISSWTSDDEPKGGKQTKYGNKRNNRRHGHSGRHGKGGYHS